MNIYLVRHGETENNFKKVYYGKLDVELNDNGKEQIKKTKQKLNNIKFSLIYTSCMKRAIQTAEILVDNKDYIFIQDKRINEMDLGEFEGKGYEEIKTNYLLEWQRWSEDWKNFAPPKGESYVEFYGRVKSFIEDIIKTKDDNILIVTHGGVIKSILAYILGENLDIFWKFASKNGDVTLIKYEYGNFYIDSIVHCD
ncbi:alpha-ribazole phosphatase [Clostridium tetanomorphum]|uniref:Alpha-ribazole phosphatase n=1 Tax=Clostridium tetanomorphum TaxID=1553 RepID=A0A923IZY9_CLOTT|nr:alpha-ribazole phosphatase [Clostridium tetanomorphum]KAJ50328.1 alpha-ribazole-5'-phosphate phosphatase [Clostridium tetanomorphum DSM 665]MBC2397781.1 alpha-ribazole phosphatase [Clostridium tetanomorphum]MBP1866060.1 alpha-ribazole phosphatase [Clostridium tetanomorphum]NRS83261.1 alpha-ribazole phosphatase [Clostridium tetanomorphum]NRZ96465.1 alpha-ribazole phosphatase [Clostridium tetanomorphum]